MATKLSEETVHCECRHGCPTSATITIWSCGCIEVDIHDDVEPGSDCTDFSAMRNSCGESGSPRED